MSTKTAPTKKAKKPKKKRLDTNVGDLVAFSSMIVHMTGTVGEVTHVLDRDRVVIKAIAPNYEAYTDSEWVVLTYKPSGITPDGEDLADVTLYLDKIVYRRDSEPSDPKPPKPPKPVVVLEGQDALLEHLASTETPKADVVYIPDSEATP